MVRRCSACLSPRRPMARVPGERALVVVLLAAVLGLGACQGNLAVPTQIPFPNSTAPAEPLATPSLPLAMVTRPAPTQPPTAPLASDPLATRTTVPAETLISAYRMVREDGPDGRGLQRITGWADGLLSSHYGLPSARYCEGPYRWLDSRHLLLFPLAGRQFDEWGANEFSWPLVVNLEDGRIWPVPMDGAAIGSCQVVGWSPAWQRLITKQSGEILTLDLDGQVVRRYPGGQQLLLAAPSLQVSPSGRQLIARSGTGVYWYDLETGRGLDLEKRDLALAAWSADESRIFSCCFEYLDTQTGENRRAYQMDGLEVIGRGGGRSSSGWWVLGDQYFLLPEMLRETGDAGRNVAIVLIDPLRGTGQDVLSLAGLGEYAAGFAQISAPSPDGNLIFAVLNPADSGPGYLIDLRTFTARRVEGSDGRWPGDWSADGRFILLRGPENNYSYVAVEQAALYPVGSGMLRQAAWAPVGSRLAYLAQDGRALTIVDPGREGTGQRIDLPVVASQAFWRGDGAGLAVAGEDGSLWRLADGTGQAEKLAEARPGLHDVRWSPDGEWIAFVSGADVCVVRPLK